jgi:hypothetical protein
MEHSGEVAELPQAEFRPITVIADRALDEDGELGDVAVTAFAGGNAAEALAFAREAWPTAKVSLAVVSLKADVIHAPRPTVPVQVARRTPGRSSAPGRKCASRGHIRRDDPGRKTSGGDDDPPLEPRRFEVDLLGRSRRLNGHRPWRGSREMVELVLDEPLAARVRRDRATRRALEQKEAESRRQDAERKPRCSRCDRQVDHDDLANNGRRGKRPWCKRCDVRLRKGYARSRRVEA